MRRRFLIAGVAAALVSPIAVKAQTVTTYQPQEYSALFCNGADGDVTISSGTTTLSRDMCYRNLTINGTGSLVAAGYRIFVSGTLDLSAAPANAIAAGTPGFVLTPSQITGRSAVTGGTGAGTAGTAAIPTANGIFYGGTAGASGAGGTASAGATAGGAAGAASSGGSPFRARISYITPSLPLNILFGVSTFGLYAGGGGASGGAGAGDGSNAGGNGGAGGNSGAVALIFAANIARGTNSTAGIISVVGSAGSAGTNAAGGNAGGGGGGSGGGGGFVYIVAGQMTGSTITNAIDVSGGVGGAGGNGAGTGKGGNGGASGNGGYAVVFNMAAGTLTFPIATWNTSGNAGSTTSTATGAAGGTVVTVQGNL